MSVQPWDSTLRGPQMASPANRAIYKYQMPVKEKFSINLPAGAEIIRVSDIDGLFWLWAVVDINAESEERNFRAFKTGAEIPDDIKLHYIGFCAIYIQMELGLYIFEEVQCS